MEDITFYGNYVLFLINQMRKIFLKTRIIMIDLNIKEVHLGYNNVNMHINLKN